jgi:hypothetical protein
MRNGRRLAFATLSVTLLALLPSACRDSTSIPAEDRLGPLQSEVASDTDSYAREELRAASNGRRVRGDQDEMLRVEVKVAGFAGFYLDSVGGVVILARDTSRRTIQLISTEIGRLFGARAANAIGPLATNVLRPTVMLAKFSLSELVGFQQRVVKRRGPFSGLQIVGISIPRNQLSVVVQREDQVADAARTLQALGIPTDGAVVRASNQELLATTTWVDKVRPTRGGVKVLVRGPGGSSYGCSHGFNVHRALPFPYQTQFSLTAGHCVNIPFGSVGQTGDTLFQATISHGAVARVQVNPAWPSSGCPTAADGQPAEWCPAADVLLSHPVAGVSFERKVGASTYEGHNGNPGTQTISGWYPIAGVITPETVFYGRNVAHRSGWISGTTTGEVVQACQQVQIKIPTWGGTPTSTMDMIVPCAAVITGMGSGMGDSGGPVFARQTDGGAYFAVGQSFAGTITPGSTTCQEGSSCIVIFAPWATLESYLGVGSLVPTTVIP